MVQHSPFQPLLTLYRSELSRVHMVQCGHTPMMTITLRVQNFNSLLNEMIIPQTYIHTSIYLYTYIHIYIKPPPVSRVFRARSGSPRIRIMLHYKIQNLKTGGVNSQMWVVRVYAYNTSASGFSFDGFYRLLSYCLLLLIAAQACPTTQGWK